MNLPYWTHTPQSSSHTQLSEHCQVKASSSDQEMEHHRWEPDQPEKKDLTTLALGLPQQTGQAKSPYNEPNVSKTHPHSGFLAVYF